MALHPDFEKERENMFEPIPEAKPCPKSGLTPEPNHWTDDAWFYECDRRCPHIKNCRLATPVYVHQTDAEAGWNRLVKDVKNKPAPRAAEPVGQTMSEYEKYQLQSRF